jgi:hypothetical protein
MKHLQDMGDKTSTMKNFVSAAVGLFLWATVCAQNYSLTTNVLDYIDFGTLNLEASCGIARQWTLSAGVKYNPFSWGEGRTEKADKQRSLEAGARFWPWHIYSGWWLAAKAQYQEYNIGGFVSPETREGDRVGGALSTGYTYMLGPHFNIEAGTGIWAGRDWYKRYSCPTCGRTIDQGKRTFVMLNEVLLGLSYVF